MATYIEPICWYKSIQLLFFISVLLVVHHFKPVFATSDTNVDVCPNSLEDNSAINFVNRRDKRAVGMGAWNWPRNIFYVIRYHERGNDVKAALGMWQQYSCLTFHEHPGLMTQMRFVQGSNCSRVGHIKKSWFHEVSFTEKANIGTIVHEVGHALGLTHTHQRSDRNLHLDMDEGNIKPEFQPEYALKTFSNTFNVPYDAGSIMHYSAWGGDFAIDDQKKVMIPKDLRFTQTMGQQMGPSFLDLLLVNRFYQCQDICQKQSKVVQKCEFGGFPNPKDCSKCVCPSGFGGNQCEKLAGDCGAILQASQESKLFDESVQRLEAQPEQECHWQIRAPPGHRIRMSVIGLAGVCARTCGFGFAEIKFGQDMGPTGIRLCCVDDLGQEEQLEVESEGNIVVVSLFSKYGEMRLQMQYSSFIQMPVAGPIALQPLLEQHQQKQSADPQVNYIGLARKFQDFASEAGAFTQILLLCKGQQFTNENDVLEKVLCPMVQKMYKNWKTRMSYKLTLDQLQTFMCKVLTNIVKVVKEGVAKFRDHIGGLLTPDEMKAESHVPKSAELSQLKELLMDELNKIKKVVAPTTRNFSAPVHPSVLANVYKFLTTLVAMDTLFYTNFENDPEENLPWALTEFSVSIWAMAALKVHPELGQIAIKANEWITFHVPAWHRNALMSMKRC